MARANATRPDRMVLSPVDPPPYRELIIGQPPRGMSSEPGASLEQGFVRDVQGFVIRDGVYTVQDPIEAVGVASSTKVMAIAPFVEQGTTYRLVRFTKTGVAAMNGVVTSWSSLTGSALTGGDSDYFSWAGWGEGLLFTNGKDGLFFIDFGAGTYTLVLSTLAKYVTVMGKRVILSGFAATPYRIQWSVKGDYTDWTGLGSGLEDLLATPGGQVGEVMGVHPYADNEAWVLRQDSLWTMRETGYFDAPFVFNRRFDGIGSASPWSAAMSPVGFFYLSYHGAVILANPDGYSVVSKNILGNLALGFTGISSFSLALVPGAWSNRYQAYTLVPDTVNTSAAYGYSYNPKYDAWTKIVIPGGCRRLAAMDYIDNATSKPISSFFYAHVNHHQVTRDNQLTWGTEASWVHPSGTGTSNIDINMRTSWFSGASPYEGVLVNKLDFLYQLVSSDTSPPTGLHGYSIYLIRSGDSGPTILAQNSTGFPVTSILNTSDVGLTSWRNKPVWVNVSANSFLFLLDFDIELTGFQLHSVKIQTTSTTLLNQP